MPARSVPVMAKSWHLKSMSSKSLTVSLRRNSSISFSHVTQVHQAITSDAVLMNSCGFGDPYRVRSIVDVLRGAVLLLLR